MNFSFDAFIVGNVKAFRVRAELDFYIKRGLVNCFYSSDYCDHICFFGVHNLVIDGKLSFRSCHFSNILSYATRYQYQPRAIRRVLLLVETVS